MKSNDKGRISELLAQAKYIELGYKVLEPVNKDGIYDFVIEKDGVFKRVQVKTLTDKGDFYELRTRSVNTNSSGHTVKLYTKEEIDLFVGVDISSKNIFEIPFSDCNKYTFQLRKVKPKNNQTSGIHMCKDYLLK